MQYRSDYVIDCKEVFDDGNTIQVVLELMDGSLDKLIDAGATCRNQDL